MAGMITLEALDAQERIFAEAYAAGEIERARDLYHSEVCYLSPTVRLFEWPRRIEGRERTLEFIAVTITTCTEIRYAVVDRAITPAGDAAFVRIHFDWTTGWHRLRSSYVVIYRYQNGLIAQQELYYDPDGHLETLGQAPG